MKDRKGISDMENCLFSARCANCGFTVWFKTTNLDVERTLKGKFCSRDSRVLKHMKENEGHIIPFSVFNLKSFNNAYELNVAFDLVSKSVVL